MSRIGTSLSGIERSLLNRLAEANATVALSTVRLATLQKIQHPSDDPSAFLALARLQTDLGNVTTTVGNVNAASAIVTPTSAALGDVLEQLDVIRDQLLTEDQTLTQQQRDTAQATIDQALDQINDLAGSSFEGRHTLDGSAAIPVSGRNPDHVARLTVNAVTGTGRTIEGSVTQAATAGSLTYHGAGGDITADATFSLEGMLGSASISVANGETLATAATRINDQSYLTGVTAAVDGDDLVLSSVYKGSAATVAVEVETGTFIVAEGSRTSDSGTDTIAQINGQTLTGTATTTGNRITVNDNGLRFSIEFADGCTGAFDTMTVDSGGLTFSLSPDLLHTSTLAVSGVQTGQLGGASGSLSALASGGTYSGLGHNAAQALRIVDEAIGQVTQVRGAVDGFYNGAITSASGMLADLQTTLTNSINDINLVDEDEETAVRDHAEALASNASAGLLILQQQRLTIVQLIRRIAGLDG